jgi:hypothetical protein
VGYFRSEGVPREECSGPVSVLFMQGGMVFWGSTEMPLELGGRSLEALKWVSEVFTVGFRKNLKLIKTTTTQHHNSRTTNLHNQTRKLRVRGLDMAFAQIVLNLAVRLAQPRITESLHPLVRRLSVSPWD